MKLSSAILTVTFVLLIIALFATNLSLKKEYDKIDKSDLYWTYGTILEQPFKHLTIEGGNITSIAFEQSKKSSVRIFKNWEGYVEKTVKAFVKNDTLYVKFPEIKDPNEKRYMGWITPVRIFCPELLSVNGFNTNFALYKLQQKSISIHLAGKSKLEVESYEHHFDSITVTQKDSSEVVFEMSPDLKGTDAGITQTMESKSALIVQGSAGVNTFSTAIQPTEKISSWEAMTVGSIKADIHGVSLLDVGHFQINSLQLNISDTSGIILSGGSLRRFKK